MSEVKKALRQHIRGLVVSDKMSKTRVIEVLRPVRHSLYQKSLTKKRRLFVHDERNESKVGDFIIAESCRRLSRHKSFLLKQVLEKRGL